ncbi:PqiC family protein [Oceanomicrobium pacificus]|uniref:ABC-type transport auxiliary lipoprotein component domain-containing protein n=1 Tax=Oceanomicrobium pacificus TaxID=2692916 RepID=A0A6B0TQ66_9RHOB|nr:PqiC family protein [Oceanomicrobium pacificus]MXU66086.1 hypothetical protein [Oceanomicrobium pacificus]
MTMILRLACLSLVALLAACSASDPTNRYLLPESQPTATLGSNVRTLSVRQVDLPAYARETEIAVLAGANVIVSAGNALWADSPERGMTELLAENLDRALTTRVATDPWPLLTAPDAQLDVKVSRIAGAPGASLRFTGQYFLVAANGGSLETAGRFSYNVPVRGDTIEALTQAQAEAVALLARDIAKRISVVGAGEV